MDDEETRALKAIELGRRAQFAFLNADVEQSRELIEQARALLEVPVEEPTRDVRLGRSAALLMIKLTEAQWAIHPGADRDSVAAAEELVEHVEEMESEFPEASSNDDFAAGFASARSILLQAQMGAARRAGDDDRLRVLVARYEALTEASGKAREALDAVAGLNRFDELRQLRATALGSVQRMDLDRALDTIRRARRVASEMNGSFDEDFLRTVMGRGLTRLMDGNEEISKALETWVAVLHAAVTGEVSRQDVDRLSAAEGRYRRGQTLILDGLPLVQPQLELDRDAALRGAEEGPIAAIRNLRHLCERSLSPKNRVRWAGLNFFVLFLPTVLVLFVSTKVATDGAYSAATMGWVTVVAIVVSLIGAFGFEALRFTPFLDKLMPRLPGAAPEAEE